jgi:hypothetical protein
MWFKLVPVTLALGALWVSSVGCTSKADNPGSPPTRPTLQAPSANASSSTPEQAVLAAYRGMWQAYVDAGRTTDPQYTDLDKYATGDARSALVAGLEQNKKQGLLTKGDVAMSPQVTALTPQTSSPDTASIKDCLDTSKATRVKADGSPFTDTPGGRRSVTATAKNVDGVWKVTVVVPLGVGTC